MSRRGFGRSPRKLGREREAREHAARTLELEPEVQVHRERFVRLFGDRQSA